MKNEKGKGSRKKKTEKKEGNKTKERVLWVFHPLIHVT
jgi:hypothetical protein